MITLILYFFFMAVLPAGNSVSAFALRANGEKRVKGIRRMYTCVQLQPEILARRADKQPMKDG